MLWAAWMGEEFGGRKDTHKKKKDSSFEQTFTKHQLPATSLLGCWGAGGAKLLQSCSTLCDPMNCNPPGPSVHGILQARILEWVAMLFWASSQARDQTHIPYVSCIGRQGLYH